MVRYYWVKYADNPPEKYVCKNFEEFWHILREHMMRHQLILEWIIID